MARYAIIQNGIVENVVEWDGGEGWSPPLGAVVMLAAEGVGPGWTYDGEAFQAPRQPDEPALTDAQKMERMFEAFGLSAEGAKVELRTLIGGTATTAK